ncbi:hypothetical protein EDB86DRAFT_2828800 [Lactarius hatsudake]|nr:hypothetical protein EDB86DRAFT_2828800 [Lactarius hatsudake]
MGWEREAHVRGTLDGPMEKIYLVGDTTSNKGRRECGRGSFAERTQGHAPYYTARKRAAEPTTPTGRKETRLMRDYLPGLRGISTSVPFSCRHDHAACGGAQYTPPDLLSGTGVRDPYERRSGRQHRVYRPSTQTTRRRGRGAELTVNGHPRQARGWERAGCGDCAGKRIILGRKVGKKESNALGLPLRDPVTEAIVCSTAALCFGARLSEKRGISQTPSQTLWFWSHH